MAEFPVIEMTSLRSAALPSATMALVELGNQLRRANYHFVTPTPATIARVNARPGNARARSLTDVFGWNRPFNPVLIPEAILGAMRDAGVIEECASGLRSTLRVSSLGGQLYFHSAFPTEATDSVFFGPDTYRFARQLGACVPALARRVTRCVDIGCGAGAGAIELARMCPSASVHAVDINPAALTLTRVNALLADTRSVLPEYSDLLANVDGTFDLIVANPPYLVDEGARAYRNGGGDLGAGLSLAIVNAAIGRLSPGGSLLLYTAAAIVDGVDALGAEVARRLERAEMHWTYDEIDPDIFGEELDNPAYQAADRIAAVWLRATKPASHQVYW
ncbi:methyltransferase [Massilia sp. TWR1-2-2]|uniref:methyltransferase n=1 Tax=Massilia sp. TWR1-2-2 TaxID=2804584 RepID=UPI003CEBDA2F